MTENKLQDTAFELMQRGWRIRREGKIDKARQNIANLSK